MRSTITKTRTRTIATAGVLLALLMNIAAHAIDKFDVDAGGRIPTNPNATSGVAVFTFTVAVGYAALNDVNVNLDIVHSWDEDLLITLRDPFGTQITLFDHVGGIPAFGDFNNTFFDDAAGQAIANGAPPFAGAFNPKEALTAFNGHNPNGVWTLTITDTYVGDYGYLYRKGDPKFENRRAEMGGTFIEIAPAPGGGFLLLAAAFTRRRRRR